MLTRNNSMAPAHPGAILREDVLPELNMSINEFADRLGVSRKTVSSLINERIRLSEDLAIRITRLIGGTIQTWLNMQNALDVWHLERKNAKVYEHIQPLKKAVNH